MRRNITCALAFDARRERHGIVLVIVLASVAILTILVLAFLGSIGTELQSSKIYANSSSVKLLAQSAVDLVEAEIRDATANGSYCWASQPGMIRTYDNTGAPVNYYKLYSDANMVGNGVFDHTQILVPDGTSGSVAWYQQKGVYIDLNQPIYVNGADQYPILDGDAGDLTSYTFATGTSGNTTTPLPAIIQPTPTSSANTVNVLGPLNAGKPAVAGFWLNRNTPIDSSSPNQAPMPVKWLYVLQKGEIAAPDTDTAASSTVTFNNSPVQPSASDPIVGRMAFWTDDETCKVNINTASEGTYWDVPREDGPVEQTNAYNPPVQFEFQRYPGHPAMNCLSTVFPLPASPSPALETSTYLITPRVGPGGSQEGTVQTTQGMPYTTPALNTNRLYSTVDEYLFQPTLSAGSRLQNSALSGASALTPAAVKKARFFITATSRSPDVNLFNQPRVCIWPISAVNSSANRSVYDQLIAFCTTMRTDLATPYIYYIQRQDPTDPNVDLPTTDDSVGLDRNRMLLEYLRHLTSQPIPGFGASFASKYNTPNATGTATDCDQILTEIFDYIRCTNLRDPTVTNPYTFQLSPSVQSGTLYWADPGKGQVIPIADTTKNTRGFGRFRTVQGGALLFIANADGDVPNSQPATSPVAAGYMRIQVAFIPQLFDVSYGSVFDNPSFDLNVIGLNAFQINNGTSLFASPIDRHIANASADGGFWGDQLGLRTPLGSRYTSPFISPSVDVPKASGTFSFTGGTIHLQLLTPTTTASTAPSATHPGLVVQDVQINIPNGTFPIPALAPDNVYDSPDTSNQTGPYNMRYFFNPPTPSIPNAVSGPDLPATNTPSVSGRLGATIGTDPYAWITKYDVVRSVAAPSDIRLIAAQTTNAAPGTPNYPFALVGVGGTTSWGTSTAGASGMHTLFSANGEPYWGGVWGKLVSGVNYDGQDLHGAPPGAASVNALVYTNSMGTPVLPGGPTSENTYDAADVFDPTTGGWLNGVAMGTNAAFTTGSVPGDWDTGVVNTRDGPFINKADEGDMGSSTERPYFDWKYRSGSAGLSVGLFTANRMIPSAVTFGSLPTGVFANHPWQTLLFRAGPIGHTGLGTSTTTPLSTSIAGSDQGPPYSIIPDHLLLDLFTMPVVEPYAISEPLSTAGRINMNYLIVPFNYINRDTGLRSVLKSEQVISLSDTQATQYKLASSSTQTTCRFPVDMDATLSQFYSRRFNNKDIFRSPSEICDIDIVPNDSSRPANEYPFSPPGTAPTRAQMDSYWDALPVGTTTPGHRLTGDNCRERVYSTIYPRLTTKSNSFTIHFRVQTLKPLAGTGLADPTQWREGTDVVTGEYRGSQTIERYIDPNNSSLPDFANSANYSATLAPYYTFRVDSAKQFAP